MPKLITRSGKLISRGGNLVGGAVPTPVVEYFEMIVKTDNAGTSGNNQFTIPTSGVGYDYTVETTEQLLTNQTGNVTLEWASAGTHWVRITGDFPRINFNNGGDRLKLIEVSNWGDIVWSSMQNAFFGCNNFIVTATDTPNLGSVTNMSFIFGFASSFNGDIGGWDVSSVTNMTNMFVNASTFNRDLSGWCVEQIASEPTNFDLGATSWVLPRPNWGDPC